MTTDFNSVTCPFPECGADLYLNWNMSRPIFRGDFNDLAVPAPDDAYTSSWDVGCENGHVILVPGERCSCTSDDCDQDATDDVRAFRGYDLSRLRSLLDTMAVSS